MLSIDLELFLILFMALTVHLCLDPRQLKMKRKEEVNTNLKDSFIYAIISSFIVMLFGYPLYVIFSVGIILFLAHISLEDKKLVRHTVLFLQKNPKKEVERWWLGIAADITIHVWVIFVLSIIL